METILLVVIVLIIITLFILNYKKSCNLSAIEGVSNGKREGMKSTQVDRQVGDKIVMYYTETCIHSQNMLPVWNKFEEEYGWKINIEKIDCSKNSEVCRDVNGVPTVRLYRNGKVYEYTGDRTVEKLKYYVDTIRNTYD